MTTASCADNAILEVTAVVPAADECAMNLVLEAVADARGFREPWPRGMVLSTPLGATEGRRQFSLVAEGATLDANVRLRTRVCASGACSDDGGTCAPPREAWFEIERPFYPGRFTSVFLPAATPRPVEEHESDDADVAIGRCQVAGCFWGDTNVWCFDDGNGPHFCE
jgi:hypothetical protein